MSSLDVDGCIGVYDLKNQLSAVLEEVLLGREVTVTKHGRPIARISPVVQTSREERTEAIAALRRLTESVRPMPKGMTIRDLIDTERD